MTKQQKAVAEIIWNIFDIALRSIVLAVIMLMILGLVELKWTA